jgi:hypothetical protein
MIKLNPYVKTLRRQELLRSNKRAQAIVAGLKHDTPRNKDSRNKLGKIRAISNRNLNKKKDAPKTGKPKTKLTQEQKEAKKVASIEKRKAALKLQPKKKIAKKDFKSAWLKDFIKNLHN